MRWWIRPRTATRFEDVLARCLAAIESGEATITSCLAEYPAHAERLGPALRTALSVRDRMAIRPDPAFVQRARARILAAAGQQAAPAPTPAPVLSAAPRRPLWRPMLAASATATVLIGIVLPLAAVTSADALPGDWNYGIKLTMEDLHQRLTLDPESRAEYEVYRADRRADELVAVVRRGDLDEVESASREYQKQLDRARNVINNGAPAPVLDHFQKSIDQQEEKIQTAINSLPPPDQVSAPATPAPTPAPATGTPGPQPSATPTPDATTTDTPASSTPAATASATAGTTAPGSATSSPAAATPTPASQQEPARQNLQQALDAAGRARQDAAAAAARTPTPTPTAPPRTLPAVVQPAGGQTPTPVPPLTATTAPAVTPTATATPLPTAVPTSTPLPTEPPVVTTRPATVATATPTPQPTATPTPRATPVTPAPTPTPAPQPTRPAAPTATPTPQPTETPRALTPTPPPVETPRGGQAATPAATATDGGVRPAVTAATSIPTPSPTPPASRPVTLVPGRNTFIYVGISQPVESALEQLAGKYTMVEWRPPGTSVTWQYRPGVTSVMPTLSTGSIVVIDMTESVTVGPNLILPLQ